MRRFVISDSHGGYKALVQCLQRSGFDKEKDQLFFIGDVVDGWPETKESVDLLLTLKNLVYLLGNHDQWALNFYGGTMKGGPDEIELWLLQGGAATVESYGTGNPMPKEHLKLLRTAPFYHVTADNILFVHAGFDPSTPIEASDTHNLIWNRDFIRQHYKNFERQASATYLPAYKEIYIGHTPTISFNHSQTTPLQMGNVILTDTGAAFTGLLTIMNIDSKEIWQSDPVMTLYPDAPGRNGRSWNMTDDKSETHFAL